MILLDANALIWWSNGDSQLGPNARRILETPSSRLITSLLTLFEIELKIKSGKLRLDVPIIGYLERFNIEVYSPGAQELPALLNVSLSHRDPFDRALMGLAQLKSWDVMTSDLKLLAINLPRSTIINSRK